jgi:hypothetical protein
MQSVREMGDRSDVRKLARETLVNITGWSMEYMVTHLGFIVADPLLYRSLSEFTAKYLVSPLGLIGRGTIWLGRGLYAISDDEARPDNVRQVLEQAGVDLVALATVQTIYAAGSTLTGHHGLLVEKTFVDTVVTSAASALLAGAVRSVSAGRWGFGRREDEGVRRDGPVVAMGGGGGESKALLGGHRPQS